MFDKLSDAAGLIKAKITKDDLEQKLVQATSEENWQASTNILHEICNAAYNYEKWQKINDFIWEKLKKKSSWRKVIKTLNLVEFLLKNGPPSIISSFKYDVYQFRTYSDYQHYSDGIDRGEAIREKAKQLVELLSNDDLLEEEREKAKTIRDRMSGIVGGVGYGGGYGGDNSKYESFNSKSYGSGKPSSKSYSYGQEGSGGMGVYGDYNYNKSTLDKYKANEKPSSGLTKPIVDITGHGSPVVDIVGGNVGGNAAQENKKAFSKIAPKLVKPSAKKDAPNPSLSNPQQQNKVVQDIDFDITTESPKLEAPPQQKKQSTPFSFEDFTIQTPQHETPPIHSHPTTNPIIQPQNPQQNQSQPTISTLYHNQPNVPINPPLMGYPQQPYMMGGYQPNMGYQQPNVGYQQPNVGYQQPNVGYQQQNVGYQQPNVGYQQQNVGYQQPNVVKQSNQQFSLSLSESKEEKEDFGTFQSGASQSNSKVKWLSESQKGLIDFSDFSSAQTKVSNEPKKGQVSNGIKIDAWDW